MGESERDATIFCGVGTREEAGVVPVLHVFAISSQDPGVGTCLGKNLAQEGEIKAKRSSETETFGESGGVDIHDHVDECLDLSGLARCTNVAERVAKILEDRFRPLECRERSAGHQIESSLAGLGDAGGHAGLERIRTCRVGEGLDITMDFWRDSGAVHKKLTGGADEEAIAALGKDRSHGLVICHDRDDDAGQLGGLGEGFANFRTDLSSQVGGESGVVVVDGCDAVSFVFKTAGHIGSHATDSYKCYGFISRHECFVSCAARFVVFFLTDFHEDQNPPS